MNRQFRLVVCALALGGAPLGAAEANATMIGRELIKRYADALVHVNLVLNVRFVVSGQAVPPREVKREVLATVISPDGLAVVSLVALDPGEVVEGRTINTPRGPVRIDSVETEFKDAKIRRPDGTETTARVLLKDNDLDLAFIAPARDATAGPFMWVDLANEGTADLLTTAYVLTRATRGLQGTPLVRRSDIIGVVEKPRRLLVIEYPVPGYPVFNEKGQVLGLSVRRMYNGRPAGIVVLAAADVAEMAQQAEAARQAADANPAPAAPAEPAPTAEPPEAAAPPAK